jgi:hypothetical protein
MSDGFLRADSTNPDGTWEQFEIDTLEKDMILNRKELFEFLDQLSRDGKKFTSLTYAVNEWSMGGVVRLKHHSIILTEGDHHLKFDFGRWGIGWSLSHFFPVLPKGTCKQDRFDIQADPEVIKRYCLDVKEFSWLTNNCSSFSEGLMQELKVSEPSSLLDMWPTWSRCVAGVKVPTRRPPQTAAADAPPAAPEPPPVTHTVRCEHGTFLVALPDGLVKTDSRSSSGDWERFVVVEAGGDKVALRSHHGRYLSARPDGSAKAVVTSLDEDSARFRPLPHPSGRVLFETYEGKYLVAMPDGAMRADSTNPQGTWEQFEIANLDLEKALTSEQAEVGELEVIHDIDELAQSLPDVPESSRSHQAEQPDNIHNIDELAQSLPDVPEFSRSKDGHGSKPAFSFESQTSVADSTPSSESRHMHLGPVCIVNDVIGEEDGITEVLLVEPTPICRFDYFETSKKRSLMHDSGSGNAQIISL